MFRLSKAAKYSIQGIIHLASGTEGEIEGIESIARSTDVPAAYLAKLFQTLGKHGLLKSVRGPEGGFTLSREPAEISVLDVIEAIEGPVFTEECLVHEGECPRGAGCPARVMWADAQMAFLEYLRGCSIKELLRKTREKGSARTKPPPGGGAKGRGH